MVYASDTTVVRGAGRRRPGFTLIELIVGISIIFLLMGLLIGGIHFMTRAAKSGADVATITALKNGVSQFEQQFGFVPPLVKDRGNPPGFSGGPLVTVAGEDRPFVYSPSVATDLAFLRAMPVAGQPDLRFSVHSLPYYLMGVLDLPRSAASPTPIDGVAGPRFKAVRRDGSFEKAGRDFNPFFDVSRNARAIFETQPGSGKIELRDARGAPFRYYRWEHDSGGPVAGAPVNDYLNVPELVGDPSLPENVELRSAEYAIVGAGSNGVFGDEMLPNHPQPLTWSQMAERVGVSGDTNQAEIQARIVLAAKSDNVVGVGR